MYFALFVIIITLFYFVLILFINLILFPFKAIAAVARKAAYLQASGSASSDHAQRRHPLLGRVSLVGGFCRTRRS